MILLLFQTQSLLCRLAIMIVLGVSLGCIGNARGSGHAAHEESSSDHGGDSDQLDAADTDSSGIKLGDFKIRAYYPVESQKSAVTFTLFATVAKDKRADSQHLLAHRLHKVRDQVILATRLAPLADFEEPDLATFRRRIVVQLRRTLPELSIDNVFVSEFELVLERL